LGGAFAFVSNGTAVMTRPNDGAAFSPAVALQLSVDACGRTFVVDDGEVNVGAVSLFRRLSSDPERRSLSSLFRWLWKSSQEWESIFAGPRGCVRSLPDSVSLLSVEAVNSLLSDITFCIALF
jgi:hypothetical protein